MMMDAFICGVRFYDRGLIFFFVEEGAGTGVRDNCFVSTEGVVIYGNVLIDSCERACVAKGEAWRRNISRGWTGWADSCNRYRS